MRFLQLTRVWWYLSPGQVATAKGMGIIGEKINAQAVLALGDNFYTYGMLSHTSTGAAIEL
jgi:hypothetical protein